MSENIIELNLNIDNCQKENIPALSSTFDIKKAFDIVEWEVSSKIMYAFVFSKDFVQMIMIDLHCGF